MLLKRKEILDFINSVKSGDTYKNLEVEELSTIEEYQLFQELLRKRNLQMKMYYSVNTGMNFEIINATKDFKLRKGIYARKLNKNALNILKSIEKLN